MLNDFQIARVWENMLAAETRALYFADLTARYTRRKQWITGGSFFLSSGAAATLIGKAPTWVPILLALVVAGANAYVMAINLDRKIGTLAKLFSAWAQIASDYERLWSHARTEEAEGEFERIIDKERQPSELAAQEAPNDQKLLAQWQQHVFAMYHLKNQSA